MVVQGYTGLGWGDHRWGRGDLGTPGWVAGVGVGCGLGGPCCPFPPHGWSAPGGHPLLLRKQPIWAAGETPHLMPVEHLPLSVGAPGCPLCAPTPVPPEDCTSPQDVDRPAHGLLVTALLPPPWRAQHSHTECGSHTKRDEGKGSGQGGGGSEVGEATRTAGIGNQNAGDGGACAWGAATTQGMAWPASPVATGAQPPPLWSSRAPRGGRAGPCC